MNDNFWEEKFLTTQGESFTLLRKTFTIALDGNPAIYLSELINWRNYLKEKKCLLPNESFYMEGNLIERNTGFDKSKQSRILNILKEKELISCERRGTPSRNYYSINFKKVYLMTENSQQNQENPILESENLDSVENPPILDSENYNSRFRETNKSNKEEAIKTESKIQEELRSSSLIDSYAFRNESSLDIVVPLKRRAITTPIVFESQSRRRYRKDIVDIITYWNSSPGLSRIRTPFNDDSNPTKTFESVVKTVQGIMKGNYFNSVGLSKYERVYTKEELITTIDRFKLMATNPSYLPTRKDAIRKVGLGSFFYNPYANGMPSYFIKCLEEEPKYVTANAKAREDKNPNMTKLLKEIYVDMVLMGEVKDFNRMEENKFIEGAEKLQKFIKRIHPRVNMIASLTQWAEFFVNSLVEKWGVSQIYPGHLCADHSFNDVFVRHLKNKGRID